MRIRSVLYAAAALLCAVEVSHAQSFTNFYAFGDSTVDSGWWKAALPGNATGTAAKDNAIAASIAAGGTGAPVGAGYLVNSQILASYFGLSAVPANQPGGTNYAVSGAYTAADAFTSNAGNANPNPNLPSTVQQIADYLAAVGGVANPNGLYLISSGGNDRKIAGATQADMAGQASLLAAAIKNLQAAGAAYIVVDDTHSAVALSVYYSQQLWSDLAASGVNFIPADTQAMVRAVQSNPTMFGFTAATVLLGTNGAGNTSSACINTVAGLTTGWSQWCVNTTTPSSAYAYLRSANAQQTSFYADDEHFSAAGQKIEADYTYSLIVAPSEISFLAETPLKTRAGVVNAIWNQIPLSQGQPGNFHGWATGDLSSLALNNNSSGFPNDPGTPVNFTAGFDYRLTSEWLTGLALSVGTTQQTFSLGGDFKESEFAATLYAAYLNEPYWFNAAVTWGALNYDVNRQVPIGISVQSNTGSTKGSNISFATEFGYDFKTAVGSAQMTSLPVKAPSSQLYLTHGPVLGLVLQRVHVDGYTETDAFAAVGGFTALSFGDQTRDSAVSEIGYQASLDLGKWQPFAKIAWNHEWASLDRSVTASLTSTVAPAYSLPAVILGRDWGSGMVGTRLKVGQGMTGYVAFMSELAQNNATVYGGQIGLNVSLDPILTAKAMN